MSKKVLEGTEVRIGDMFTGHLYYSSSCNVRGFAWSVKEANELLAPIESVALEEDVRSLGPIIITPHTLTKQQTKRIGIPDPKVSQMFDIHDGQQRLVTLCLLLAVCRDVLQKVNGIMGAKSIMDENDAPTALKRFSDAIAIKRTKANAIVPRIAMADLEPLRSILTQMEPVVSAEDVPNAPSPTKKSRKELSPEDEEAKRIRDVYEDFLNSFDILPLGPRVIRAVEIGTKILDQMVVIKMVYLSVEAAQQQVQDQYHGTRIKPLQFFMYTIHTSAFDKKTTKESCRILINGTSEVLAHDACLAVAKGLTALDDDITEKRVTRTKEVVYFNKIAGKITTKMDGAAFLQHYVSPATNLLQAFRNKTTLAVTDQALAQQTIPFLQYAAHQGSRCKDLESVIIFALLVLKNEEDLRFILKDCLEPIFLWMMMTKTTPNVRAECCIKILKTLATKVNGRLFRTHSSIKDELELTPQEKKATHDSLLPSVGFGGDEEEVRGRVQLKVERAVCQRLNCLEKPSIAASRSISEFGLVHGLDGDSDDDGEESGDANDEGASEIDDATDAAAAAIAAVAAAVAAVARGGSSDVSSTDSILLV